MDTIDLGQESDGEREPKPVFIGDVSVVTKGVYLLHNLQFEGKKEKLYFRRDSFEYGSSLNLRYIKLQSTGDDGL